MPASDPVLLTLSGAIGWAPLAVALLAALIAALAMRSHHPGLGSATLRLLAGVLTFIAVFGYFTIAARRDDDAARRALAMRQATLAAQALAPGSALACLDDAAGETVGVACEKAVFATPETTAAAVGLTAARLSLLADMTRLDLSADPGLRAARAQLRRSIELDRYGLAAHVLADRDGCTADKCEAFAWVGDPTVLKTNLRGQPYGVYVDRHAAQWKNEQAGGMPVASAAPAAAPQADAGRPRPAEHAVVSSQYDFPSAASIPPVSIMNAEPPRTDNSAATAAQAQSTAADTHLPMPPKRPAVPPAEPR
ncbi:MAG: hypothetical protein OJF62_000046 [Pseudolabrys sp.]|jgi:hypothetical protein|nr:hypothetical protein [Pseudolabrys sp.]